MRWKEQQNSFRWGVSVWHAYAGLCYPPNQLIQKALNVIELDALDDLKENDRLVKCVRYQSRWLPYMYILLICALISSNKCTDEKKQVKAVQDSPRPHCLAKQEEEKAANPYCECCCGAAGSHYSVNCPYLRWLP